MRKQTNIYTKYVTLNISNMKSRYLDVGAEVVDLAAAGLLQVIVGPAQQQLLG